ncbi:MAG: hypothetical protein U0525_04560 [Patescibacteria group bacterium]
MPNKLPDPVTTEDREYYTETLSPNADEVESEDNIQNEYDVESTDLGGTMDRDFILDQGSTSVTPGTPGHPEIDEDTG